jgi:DNA polymerase-3 subunit beta
MKLTILQENFKKGVSIINRVVPKSLSLPILNNLLIKTEKNFLNLVTTDLEIGINWWSLAKVEKEGKTTVPMKILSNFINLLPNKPVDMYTENNDLVVECQSYKTKIKTLSAEDFPIIPRVSEDNPVSINSLNFCQSLSQIVDIAQPSSARPEISGVYFSFRDKLLKIVATDSFRLGEKKLTLEKLEQGYSIILPQKAVREIINIFGEKEEELKIFVSPNQVLFSSLMAETDHPQVQLISRTIEGEYPNYEAIIPKGYKTSLLLEKNEFLNQIKAASLFSGKINEVKLRVDPKKDVIEIFSQSPELGEYRSFAPGKAKGEKVEVSFNHRFLIDGILNIKGEDLNFEVNGEDGPAALKPTTDQNYIYIIMPMKTD